MLQNAIWVIFTHQFGLRSIAPHVKMMWGDVTLHTDSEGKEYLQYSERTTKTRTGKTTDVRPFAPKAFSSPGKLILSLYIHLIMDWTKQKLA